MKIVRLLLKLPSLHNSLLIEVSDSATNEKLIAERAIPRDEEEIRAPILPLNAFITAYAGPDIRKDEVPKPSDSTPG